MKKITLAFGIIAAFFCLNANLNKALAENIDLRKAQQVAANFMGAQTTGKALPLDEVSFVYEIPNVELNIPALYFFNTTNGGFCVVSGSDCLDPILAYSTERVLDVENIPPSMLWFLQGYSDIIVYAQLNDDQAPADALAAWDKMLNGNIEKSNSSKAVYNTLTSTWNQDYPYNYQCPFISGTQAPTGCVATAMGQIINYWEYPICPKGSPRYSSNGVTYGENLNGVVYDYSLMPDTYNPSQPWSNAQRDMTAMFNYHVGLANKMKYGAEASGATPTYQNTSQKALTNYFKYQSTGIQTLLRYAAPYNTNFSTAVPSNYVPTHGDTLWFDLVSQEIMAKRPVFYGGHDNTSSGRDAGHAFVMDKYNPDVTHGINIHVNWGWGGSGDCYVNLLKSKLNAAGYKFHSDHHMIIGIQPPADTLAARNVGISQAKEDIELMPAYPNPASKWITLPYIINDNQGAKAELQIFSIDGRLVERRSINANDRAVSINVENYAHGIYTYRINGVARKFVVE